MIEALGYLWLRPWALGLVGLALLMGALLVRRAVRLGGWANAADPDLMAAMRRMGRVVPGHPTRNWLPALVLAALGLALAGPAAERRDAASYRNLDAVVIVLDLSPSVTEGDGLFDVLTVARLIVDAASTRQTGIVVYSGEAYLAAPLSNDARATHGLLALIDAQTMPVRGSRPVEGLTLAAQVMQDIQSLAGDVVLISDGGGLDDRAIGMARSLAARNIAVSAVRIPGPAGNGVVDAVVRAGGGALGTLQDPFPVVDRVASRPADRLAETDYAMLLLEDLGRYLLLLALVPAFFLLPRRGSA